MPPRSYFTPRGQQAPQVRWRIPEQLRRDLTLLARYTGNNESEIVAVALYRLLPVLREKWNEDSAHSQIPELASLRDAGRRHDVRDLLHELRSGLR